MAYQNSTVPFEKMLLNFISNDDPMLSMLKWLCEKLMETEVQTKLGAEKSEKVLQMMPSSRSMLDRIGEFVIDK